MKSAELYDESQKYLKKNIILFKFINLEKYLILQPRTTNRNVDQLSDKYKNLGIYIIY